MQSGWQRMLFKTCIQSCVCLSSPLSCLVFYIHGAVGIPHECFINPQTILQVALWSASVLLGQIFSTLACFVTFCHEHTKGTINAASLF